LLVVRAPVWGLAVAGLLVSISCFTGGAADWPMWGGDGGRTHTSADSLPGDLHLLWTRELPRPVPAWPDMPLLGFDAAYEPIVAGSRVFVASMLTDSVTAYDADTGTELWRSVAEGPVRLAPCVAEGRVIFGSDDGWVYCVDAASGAEMWRHRPAPRVRRVLGNGRLISTWPVRGGPVVTDGVVYVAAGIWPFMGVFVEALDLRTGEPLWSNSGTGATWTVQPHKSPAFASVGPQGYLAVAGDTLLVPGGRSVPAGFDLRTGDLRYYRLCDTSAYGIDTSQRGGWQVAALGGWFYNAGTLYRADSGEGLLTLGAQPVVATDRVYCLRPGTGVVCAALEPELYEVPGRRGDPEPRARAREIERLPVPSTLTRLHALAGDRLLLSGPGSVATVSTDRSAAAPTWCAPVQGQPVSMVPADGKLFVSTDVGRLYCFGSARVSPRRHPMPAETTPEGVGPWGRRTDEILQAAGQPRGYAVVLGPSEDGLIEALVARAGLHVIVVDDDADRVAAFRGRMLSAGLYGQRVHAIVDDPTHPDIPAYMAELVLATDSETAARLARPDVLTRAYQILRPYGGTACLVAPGSLRHRIARQLGTEYEVDDWAVYVRRAGPLPGAADWTHNYADAANSIVSADQRVKAPLGLLWFGGPSNEAILPRHGHGPNPQVVDGRIIVEGPDLLRALDSYTGRLLWETALPDVGQPFDETRHQPGASGIGSNYVSLHDGIYVAYGDACLRLDPRTGERLGELRMPADVEPVRWGFISAWEDVLFGGDARMDLWSPEFTAVDLRSFDAKRLQQTLDSLAGLVGYAADRREGEADRDFIVRHLNALLRLPDLLSVIPQAERERVDATALAALRRRAQTAAGSGLERDLADVNRQTLAAVYGLPYTERKLGGQSLDATASSRLVAMDRYSGDVLWEFRARNSFRHNAIAVGGGMVFCIDRLPDAVEDRLRRRGEPDTAGGRLIAVDARTGREVWSDDERAFGTWLSYSEEYGLLVQAASAARDRLMDEVGTRITVYRGATGEVVWDKPINHSGPVMLHHDTLITQREAYSLLTGDPIMRRHPVTGEELPWAFDRNYGCNTAIGSEHLLTFRSAAAGYFDLARDGGTGNLGGFRSSCTSNLIPAAGVLNVPDYTRTCTCSYQNQSSIGLVYDPEAEMWTFSSERPGDGAVERVGINLAAPGDRRDDDGTLWLDWPSAGSPSPDLDIVTTPEAVQTFRVHASVVVSGPRPWVCASGAIGLEEIRIPLGGATPRAYRLTLYFVEPRGLASEQRVFDVDVQGHTVLAQLDVAKEAGGPWRGMAREVNGVVAGEELVVRLQVVKGEPVLCGIEIVAE